MDRLEKSFWKSCTQEELDKLEDKLFESGVFKDLEHSFAMGGKKQQIAPAAEHDSVDMKEKMITFLDGRKAQNISTYIISFIKQKFLNWFVILVIFLGGLKNVSLADLQKGIRELDTDLITDLRAKMINSFLPTADELKLIKAHRKEVGRLRKAEEFLVLVRLLYYSLSNTNLKFSYLIFSTVSRGSNSWSSNQNILNVGKMFRTILKTS